MALQEKVAAQYIRTKFALLSAVSKKKAAQSAFDIFITPPTRVSRELPPLFAEAENLSFQFQDKKIHGYRWGHPSQRKLLIMHGFESSVVNFESYINPLLAKGFEVLAFDAPAHGRSQGKQINAIDYKNFVLEVIRLYGPITSFITHSFGGLAISLVLEELPHDESWKVVFIAPATESVTAMNHFFRWMKLDAFVRKEFDDLITRANNKPPSWYSVSRAAKSIKAQVLFLQDRQDEITPLSDVEPIMQMKYPNFRFIISDGLGHSRIYRDPGTIKAVIDFL